MTEAPTTGVTRVCVTCQQVYGYKEQHVCPKGGATELPPDPLVGATLGGRYLIETADVRYESRHVVVATGPFTAPSISCRSDSRASLIASSYLPRANWI